MESPLPPHSCRDEPPQRHGPVAGDPGGCSKDGAPNLVVNAAQVTAEVILAGYGLRHTLIGGNGGEDLSAFLFSGVHTHIGFDAEGVGIPGVVGENGDAYAGADANALACEGEWLGEKVAQRMGDGGCGFVASGFFENHSEFIAPGARNGVGAADAGFKESGDVAEEQVSHVMSEGVVHMLEAV